MLVTGFEAFKPFAVISQWIIPLHRIIIANKVVLHPFFAVVVPFFGTVIFQRPMTRKPTCAVARSTNHVINIEVEEVQANTLLSSRMNMLSWMAGNCYFSVEAIAVPIGKFNTSCLFKEEK